jgi:hypothetical protein
MRVRPPPSLPLFRVMSYVNNYLTQMLSGRSGKPCLTKFASFIWIITIIVLITTLTLRNNAWPTGVPDSVYYSVAFVLGVKTFGDIKLSNPQPTSPAPEPVPPVVIQPPVVVGPTQPLPQ